MTNAILRYTQHCLFRDHNLPIAYCLFESNSIELVQQADSDHSLQVDELRSMLNIDESVDLKINRLTEHVQFSYTSDKYCPGASLKNCRDDCFSVGVFVEHDGKQNKHAVHSCLLTTHDQKTNYVKPYITLHKNNLLA